MVVDADPKSPNMAQTDERRCPTVTKSQVLAVVAVGASSLIVIGVLAGLAIDRRLHGRPYHHHRHGFLGTHGHTYLEVALHWVLDATPASSTAMASGFLLIAQIGVAITAIAHCVRFVVKQQSKTMSTH